MAIEDAAAEMPEIEKRFTGFRVRFRPRRLRFRDTRRNPRINGGKAFHLFDVFPLDGLSHVVYRLETRQMFMPCLADFANPSRGHGAETGVDVGHCSLQNVRPDVHLPSQLQNLAAMSEQRLLVMNGYRAGL